MAKRILILSHQLLMFIIFWYTWSKMTSPLLNYIVSYAAVYATLSVHERHLDSLALNDKLAAGWHPTSCSRPERCRVCSMVTDLVQWKRCWLVEQELIRRWDTGTWRDTSPICLLIYHWTTTHMYVRHIFWVMLTCYISNGRRFMKCALRILLLSNFNSVSAFGPSVNYLIDI